MRRRKKGDNTDLETIKARLKGDIPSWMQLRLIALKLSFNLDNSYSFIAETVGVSRLTVIRWCETYHKEGLEAVLTRGYGIGRPSALDDQIESFLRQGLENARWNTAQQARDQLNKKFQTQYTYSQVWTWLKKCAGVLRIPRPVHEKRDPQKAEDFKANFEKTLRDLPLQPTKPVKVWFADESRYGLLPNLRRVWTLKGLRPHKKWISKFEWGYCYGAIDPMDGQAVFFQTSTVDTELTGMFLEQIKKSHPEHEHIVVWDGAGFHPMDSSHKKVPDGVHLVRLPPYSPELNPIEKLWDLVQDHTANKLWRTMKRLNEVVAQHLKAWWEDPDRVISLFGENWIRSSVNAS